MDKYHGLYLARMDPNLLVSLVGYEGEKCISEIYEQENIQFLTFQPILQKFPRKLFLLFGPLKVFLQLLRLFWILLFTAGSIDLILLQNPPTIPTFIIVWICCRLKGAHFVIDWHNLGYSILGLALGETHLLVKIAKWIEKTFGKKADANLCVTQVMQKWLKNTWDIDAIVLYDKPPLFFKPTPIETQHGLFLRVGDQLKECNDLVRWNSSSEETILTCQIQGLNKKGKKMIVPRKDRPAVLISSTSWTADEDFGILLNALVLLDKKVCDLVQFPNVLVIVTGKGPQKQMYLKKIRQLALKRIRIATMWLEASDYPLILGSADVGVCLHTSSSGLDLPMKVLDMFGCGVPVCAIGFQCLHELVKHDVNGLVFTSEKQLSDQLYELLLGHPRQNRKLQKLRQALTTVEVSMSSSSTLCT
jgi:beta-1,4-mannosyltransferase